MNYCANSGAGRNCRTAILIEKSDNASGVIFRMHSACMQPAVSVESRKGAEPTPDCMPTRFPSPLIKPDVRISRIRLSDWFRCEAHGGNPAAELPGPRRSCHGEIVLFRGLVPYAAE